MNTIPDFNKTAPNLTLDYLQRLAQLGSWELDLGLTGQVTWSEETFRLLELEPSHTLPSFETYVPVFSSHSL